MSVILSFRSVGLAESDSHMQRRFWADLRSITRVSPSITIFRICLRLWKRAATSRHWPTVKLIRVAQPNRVCDRAFPQKATEHINGTELSCKDRDLSGFLRRLLVLC